MSHYGTLQEAGDYFANRLHEHAWSEAIVADRPKALLGATFLIDQLNFKGYKAPVYSLLKDNPDASDEEIREAEASQPLEFPRGADTEVPQAIRYACYEIAHALLDGKIPELELEHLNVVSQGISSVRTTYDRNDISVEHILNFIPSTLAWRWLKPFLRDEYAIRLSRVS